MQQKTQPQTLNGKEGGVQNSYGVQSSQSADSKEMGQPWALHDNDAEKEKMEQMPVIRLRTEEGRVTSKNGFDVCIRTFHLSCLQSRSLPGEGQQPGSQMEVTSQIEKGCCKD